MNDTTPEMEKFYRNLLMRKSGQERLRMGASMFATAKAMALASFGKMDEREQRVQLFLRFYGGDFDAGARDRIVAAIRAEPR